MHQLIRSPYSKSLRVIHQRRPTKNLLFLAVHGLGGKGCVSSKYKICGPSVYTLPPAPRWSVIVHIISPPPTPLFHRTSLMDDPL